ncbi:MAG: DUF1993 domain-containing protein [Sphingomonadaceae bacterium]|jgi:hypothetical protein|nr:DUF1993 domain-containing protein [Sphingomonadaceae bacterium]MCB2087158.1 DUF1993 domain-containing protein [Sphingomonadaceae bacterium]MCP5383279.1 DUF1993 domain-containing protein [Altererythrobacter sp.]MCP5392276.1 DUF1993 domain-containing protein [Sphingomonadaceae bacterium]MCP5393456.1 DUF1993 domain-containing protein [Sphingomonadaceae bacterium]
MPLTLRDALIPGWLQVTGSVRALVDKAESWCEEGGYAPSEIIGAKLAQDMLPFSYQIKSCWTHSALALESVKAGEFSPNFDDPPDTFDGLRAKLDEAKAVMEAVDADQLDAIAGNDMVFSVKDRFRLEFTVQDFLLGFSQPNFYFHATTAYDIMRMKGIAIGKIDYLGAMPVKR